VTYYDEIEDLRNFIGDLALLQQLNRKLEQATTNNVVTDVYDLTRDIATLRNEIVQAYANLYVAAHRDRSEADPAAGSGV